MESSEIVRASRWAITVALILVFVGARDDTAAADPAASSSSEHSATGEAAFQDPAFVRQCAMFEQEFARQIAARDLSGARDVQARYVGQLANRAGAGHWRTVIQAGLLADLDQMVRLAEREQKHLLDAAALYVAARSDMRIGEYKRARDRLREVIEILERLKLSKTTYYSSIVYSLGRCEAECERFQEASEHFLTAQKLCSELFGKSELRYAEATMQAGWMKLQLGDADGALKLLQEGKRAFEASVGRNSQLYLIIVTRIALTHFERTESLSRLGWLDRAADDRKRAHEYIQEARGFLDINANDIPHDPRSDVQNCYIVAAYLSSQEAYLEAAGLLKVVLAAPQDPLHLTPPATLASYHEANAVVLTRLKRTAEALENGRLARRLRSEAGRQPVTPAKPLR